MSWSKKYAVLSVNACFTKNIPISFGGCYLSKKTFTVTHIFTHAVRCSIIRCSMVYRREK